MIKVIQTGLFTTIQDGGRYGYRNIGIPTSGFMDQENAWAANIIVDNDREESLFEITLTGPTLIFNVSPKLTLIDSYILIGISLINGLKSPPVIDIV